MESVGVSVQRSPLQASLVPIPFFWSTLGKPSEVNLDLLRRVITHPLFFAFQA